MNAPRDVFGALGAAAAAPRVVLLVWFAILVPSALAAYGVYDAYDGALAHHPGAGFLLDQALDLDFARLHPEAAMSLRGGAVFALFAGAFLAGGILALVGVRSPRARFAEFLAECARFLPRSLRVLALGVVAALLLGWGIDALRGWLGDATRDVEPGGAVVSLWLFDVRWAHLFEAGAWLAGFAFLLVLFTSKVALAVLVVRGRRSALLAWAIAVGRVVRQPLRTLASVALLATLWLGGAHAIGMLTAHALEVEQQLWLGLLFGQLGAIWGAVILVAMLVAARRIAVPAATVAADEPAEEPIEPIVELPRVAPRPLAAPAPLEVR